MDTCLSSGTANTPTLAGMVGALTDALTGSSTALLEGGMDLENGFLGALNILGFGGDGSTTEGAYLNYLLFDDNFTFQSGGFDELGTGSSYTKQDILDIYVAQSGYMVAYVSYESNNADRAFYDDFKVTHLQSAVIQQDDYYPFGLTFNSYVSGTENKYKFQGQEEQTELGWVQFKWRNHDPALGRFFNADPLAEKFYYNSPYTFSENKVTNHIELEGLEAVFAQGEVRTSIPTFPNLTGITSSYSVGIAANIDDGKGMIFQTISVGSQGGIYAGGGIEFGGLPTGKIEDLEGVAVNVGGSFTPALIEGVPYGPDAGAEVNITLPTDSDGNIQFDQIKAGGTVAIPGLNYSGGATVYFDVSSTTSIMEFTMGDLKKSFEEKSGELYEQVKNLAETNGLDITDFQNQFLEHYNTYFDSEDDQ